MTKIEVKKESPAAFRGAMLAVCHFEDSKKLAGAALQLDRQSGGILEDVIRRGDFSGKHAQVSIVYTRGALPVHRILLLGLGKKEKCDLERFRRAFSKAARAARDLGVGEFAVRLEPLGGSCGLEELAEAVVEGVLLGLYRFRKFKTVDRDEVKDLRRLLLLAADDREAKRLKAAAGTAGIVSKAVYYARDLASTPSNEMTPTDLARRAREAAVSKKVKLTTLGMREMEKLGMNALLSVARGSMEPARFIILEYSGGHRGDRPFVIVGKGITFDSGGISLKPPDKME